MHKSRKNPLHSKNVLLLILNSSNFCLNRIGISKPCRFVVLSFSLNTEPAIIFTLINLVRTINWLGALPYCENLYKE